MSLISLVVTLIVVGVLLYLINSYIPMDGKTKKILNLVAHRKAGDSNRAQAFRP